MVGIKQQFAQNQNVYTLPQWPDSYKWRGDASFFLPVELFGMNWNSDCLLTKLTWDMWLKYGFVFFILSRERERERECVHAHMCTCMCVFCLMYPPKRKCNVVRSENLGDHTAGPSVPFHLSSKWLSRNCVTLQWKLGGAPASWKKNVLPWSFSSCGISHSSIMSRYAVPVMLCSIKMDPYTLFAERPRIHSPVDCPWHSQSRKGSPGPISTHCDDGQFLANEMWFYCWKQHWTGNHYQRKFSHNFSTKCSTPNIIIWF